MVRAAKQSFHEQCKALKGETDRSVLRNAHPKPSKSKEAEAPGAKHVPFTDGIYARSEDRPLVAIEPRSMTKEEADRHMQRTFYQRYFGFISMHLVALYAFCSFSWGNLAIAACVWALQTWIGICFSYHRQLTHKSFKTPKWLEYSAAWLGMHSAQGGAIEWVSNHRNHHLHTDTPLDIHSPYEGFWWSHMGWLINSKAAVERPYLDHSNAADLTSQPFYRWMESTWFAQIIIRLILTQVFFGTEGLCWMVAVPMVYGWHGTFMINSACHLWGYQTYDAGDLSTNNWVMGLLAGGEGWHNNHHAFQWSSRHGLQWWEFDATYCLIRLLEAVGLAWDVQVPTKQQMAVKRLRKQRGQAAARG